MIKRTIMLDRRSPSARKRASRRHTKIVCTIGPASADTATLEKMIRAGMDVARLNFSHGTHKSHSDLLKNIRRAARNVGKHVAILQDLCGPKVRIGNMPDGAVLLKKGQEVVFQADVEPGSDVLPVEYENLSKDVKAGNRIVFDDGNLEAKVLAVEGQRVRSRLLSPREAARLMGLPDSYKLPKNYNEAYHLAGDGLAVPVVRFFAENILEPVLQAAEAQREREAA